MQVTEIKYKSGKLEAWDDSMMEETKDGSEPTTPLAEPATEAVGKAPNELPLKVRDLPTCILNLNLN